MKKLIIYFLLFITFTFANFPSFSIAQINSLLDTGIEDYKKGQYDFAVNKLKKFIQVVNDTSGKSKAYYYLSVSYYFLGKYKLALKYFNELATKFRLSSYTTQAHFWRGLIFQNMQNWHDAESEFLKYATIVPKSELVERAYLAAANCEVTMGDLESAKKNLSILVTKYSSYNKYEEASVLYSYILMQLKKFDEAKKFLDTWMNKLGETGNNYAYRDRFWLYNGEIAYIQKDYTNAKLFFKKIDYYAKNSASSDIAILRLSQIETILGNDENARKYLIRLGNEYPTSIYNIDASLLMGISDYKKDNFNDAFVMFKQTISLVEKKLLSSDINDSTKQRLLSLQDKALYYSGEINYKNGKVNSALKKLQTIITNDGELKNLALIRYIEILQSEGREADFKKAIKKYESDLISDNAYRDRFLLFKAKSQYLDAYYLQSLDSLKKIKDKKNYKNSIALLKVKDFISMQNFADAINSLKEVYPLIGYEDKSSVALELVKLYFDTKMYSEVINITQDIQTFLKYAPQNLQQQINLEATYFMALSYTQTREYQNAIKAFGTLTKFVNTEGLTQKLKTIVYESFYYLGWLYYKVSSYDKSSKNFKIAASLPIKEKLKRDSLYMEAWCYYSKKDYKNAANKLMDIYKTFYPDKLAVKAYFQAGKSYQNMGSDDKSLVIYTKIYREFPGTSFKEDSLFEIIKIKLKQEKTREASDLISNFKNKYPNSPLYKDILLKQAETLLSLKKYSESLSVYSFFIRNFENYNDIDSVYYWAGYCAQKIKDYETAIDYLSVVVDRYNSSKFYYESLRILYKIYSTLKNYKKEEVTLKYLIKLEKDKKLITEYKKKVEELDLIRRGKSEEEASLLESAKSGKIKDKYNLAFFYYTKDDEQKGYEMLIDIANSNKGEYGARANLIIGNKKLLDKEYNDALKLFMKSVSFYQSTKDIIAESLYKSAYCYYKLEKNKSATTIINTLRDKFVDSKWTQKANDLQKRISGGE